VTRERFLEVLEERLDGLTLMLAPTNNAGVRVLDVMSARGLSFDAVLLLGMNEKSFPRLIREDPFLSDAARAALAQALGCRLGRKLDGYEEERLLFQLALEMAERELFLSYQRSDEEGKALIPSLYLHEAPSTNITRYHLARTPGEKWMQITPDRLTVKEMSVWLSREAADPSAFYKAVRQDPALFSALSQGQNELESFRLPLGTRDGVVGERPALQALVERGFSPDSLRDLAECPFRYFAGKVLTLEVMDDLTRRGDVAADASGKLIHRILEVFFRKLGKLRGPLRLEEMHRQLDEVCQASFDRFQETAAGLYPVAWRAAQDVIRARLHLFLQADLEELSESGFKPTFFEQEVEGTVAELGPELKDVRFHGRIDRIDLREHEGSTEFRVVDYKTGRASKRGLKAQTAILRGSYLQLPVYLGIAGPWLKKTLKKDVRPVEASFYNLADWERGDTSPQIGPDFWESCGKTFSENLAGLISLVRAGAFYIRPSDDMEYCAWCEFAQVCRKEHKPSAARSEFSPLRKANDQRLSRKAP
jgi:ATP-dependent helicase/nuclease subunit B